MELIPFQPVNGADTRYGQLYKPISAHPFKEAGIKGFAPIQPTILVFRQQEPKLSRLLWLGESIKQTY